MTTTCKIITCRAAIYRANMCAAHYAYWVDHGELAGATKPGRGSPPAEDDVYMKRWHHTKMMRLANAVAQAAQKWSIHDDALAQALKDWEDAK